MGAPRRRPEDRPPEHAGATRRLLTSREVARYLGVSEATLSRWRHGAVGPKWVDLCGIARYRLEDLETHLQEQLR